MQESAAALRPLTTCRNIPHAVSKPYTLPVWYGTHPNLAWKPGLQTLDATSTTCLSCLPHYDTMTADEANALH